MAARGRVRVKLPQGHPDRRLRAGQPIDEQMDYHERIRLLYVACTRARDHLILSLHRKERQTAPDADSSWTNAELLAVACDARVPAAARRCAWRVR